MQWVRDVQGEEKYLDLIEECRERVEVALASHIDAAEKQPSGEAMRYASRLLLAGGKRWRPILVLLSHRLAGGTAEEEVMPLALAFEMIHTATLVHDDINDGAALRRGVPTIHETDGSEVAIIVGDYLFVEGFGLGGEYDEEIVRLMATCCAEIASSELKQLRHINDLSTTPEDYYAIFSGKTAGPFSAGCEAAALVAGATEEEAKKLGQFGLEIGLAFQIVDDLLDLEGDERLGKPRGTDVVEGKMTLPLIHSLTLSCGDSRRRLAEVIDNFEQSLLGELTDLLNRSESLAYARTIANNHLARALQNLLEFPESDARDALEWLTREGMQRHE